MPVIYLFNISIVHDVQKKIKSNRKIMRKNKTSFFCGRCRNSLAAHHHGVDGDNVYNRL